MRHLRRENKGMIQVNCCNSSISTACIDTNVEVLLTLKNSIFDYHNRYANI